MDDSFYRKAIVDCATRIIELSSPFKLFCDDLEPLGANVTVSIPSREYKSLLRLKQGIY